MKRTMANINISHKLWRRNISLHITAKQSIDRLIGVKDSYTLDAVWLYITDLRILYYTPLQIKHTEIESREREGTTDKNF
jgi:hypothetical protein